LKTALLAYSLPEELIATRPPAERDGGRLLVSDGGHVTHRAMRDFAELVPARALVVVNDTRVFRARLVGQRESGGRSELLLLRRQGGAGTRERWTALGKPARRLRAGTRISLGEIGVEVLERTPSGELLVDVAAPDGVDRALERVGHVPLPPYLRREDEPQDAERYQTVFAKHTGSVAAPTAGLHLTPELLAALEARGVALGAVTLHVGPGTFKPVVADDLDGHVMHSETFSVAPELVESVRAARERTAPVVAVGTTVIRALESALDPEHPGRIRATHGETTLLIQPGYRFGVVDALLTNFHMPKSTLLALVAAFAGLDEMHAAYRAAVAERYRFLSYGDAMWIPKRCTA
jgi:S-adenosylmethionine:tRNA ribosyltransferase-isomerase